VEFNSRDQMHITESGLPTNEILLLINHSADARITLTMGKILRFSEIEWLIYIRYFIVSKVFFCILNYMSEN